jgi:carboxyl-terminal processing protease
MPDIFVAGDTTLVPKFVNEAFARGLISQFSLRYSNDNRHKLARYGRHESLTREFDNQHLYDKFVEFAAQKGLKAGSEEIAKSRELLTRSLYANTIYQLLGMCEHKKYVNLADSTVIKAVEVLEKGEAFPE